MFDSKYIADIRKHEVLDAQTNRELLVYFKATGDERAKSKLIHGNMRIVLQISLYFAKLSKFHTVEDYISEGYSGLIKSIEGYDPNLGEFSTYAFDQVRSKIIAAFYDGEDTIRLSRNRKLQLHRDNKAGVANADIIYSTIVSLDATIDDDDRTTVAETICGEDDVLENCAESDRAMTVKNILKAHLDERSHRVLDLCYGLTSQEPMTLTEVGEVLDVSAERIRQIRDKSLLLIRKAGVREVLESA